MNKQKYPNPPGHPQSVIDGCLCSPIGNDHGKGSGYTDEDGLPLFIFNHDCPFHGDSPSIPAEQFC